VEVEHVARLVMVMKVHGITWGGQKGLCKVVRSVVLLNDCIVLVGVDK
jgi:hypothetical protein